MGTPASGQRATLTLTDPDGNEYTLVERSARVSRWYMEIVRLGQKMQRGEKVSAADQARVQDADVEKLLLGEELLAQVVGPTDVEPTDDEDDGAGTEVFKGLIIAMSAWIQGSADDARKAWEAHFDPEAKARKQARKVPQDRAKKQK